MGTWNTSINGNDAYLDIYSKFFELYNNGGNSDEISRQLFEEFEELFDDADDRNNALFALAFAQWETKSQDPTIFEQVKEIIETGNDLEVWKELGADDKTLKKRKTALNKFLILISTEREKPKRRIKPKFEFESKELINITSPDNVKKFKVSEEFVNKKYIHTGSSIMWKDGASSILYFKNEGAFINAKWLDEQTLQIEYDKDITIIKKDDSSYWDGDEVKIIYKPK
jgi:hypothetical protein